MKKRVDESLKTSEVIDRIVENGQMDQFEESLAGAVNPKLMRSNAFQVEYPTVCEKEELKWPTRILKFNIPRSFLKVYSLIFIIPNFIRNLLMQISGKR